MVADGHPSTGHGCNTRAGRPHDGFATLAVRTTTAGARRFIWRRSPTTGAPGRSRPTRPWSASPPRTARRAVEWPSSSCAKTPARGPPPPRSARRPTAPPTGWGPVHPTISRAHDRLGGAARSVSGRTDVRRMPPPTDPAHPACTGPSFTSPRRRSSPCPPTTKPFDPCRIPIHPAAELGIAQR